MNPQTPGQPFFGQKVSKQGVNVTQATDNQLVLKDDYSTRTYYNDAGQVALRLGQLATGQFGISVPTNNGTLNFGVLLDGKLGMNTIDSSGFTLFEVTGATWYWYDKISGKNVMQVGLLPDGTYGWAVATPGNNVADSFS